MTLGAKSMGKVKKLLLGPKTDPKGTEIYIVRVGEISLQQT